MNDLYKKYKGSLKEREWVRGSRENKKYYIPKELNKTGEDLWVSPSKLLKRLITAVSEQVYYDLVVLGISSIDERPKCIYCGHEALFKFKAKDLTHGGIQGYQVYCTSCASIDKGIKISNKLVGRKLSKEHIKNLSLAKKGKKLTEEQRKRRPRNYHFSLTLEQRDKIAKSKKGKVCSRNYYKSGEFVTLKCSDLIIKFLSSYEYDLLKILDKSKNIVSIEIPDPIKYQLEDGSFHYYYSDFLITFDTGHKLLIEVKAFNLINSEKVIRKRIAGIKWCKKLGISYTTLTERDIYCKKKFFDPRGFKRINYNISLYKYINHNLTTINETLNKKDDIV